MKLQFVSDHFADKLYTLQKIKAEIADKAKNQFEVFLKDSKLHHEEEFKSFDFKKDRLDSFLATYFASQNHYNEVWHVCKLIFFLSHRQSSRLSTKKYCRIKRYNVGGIIHHTGIKQL